MVIVLILALISFNIVASSWWIVNYNLLFHTDIARDFLLMEDIVVNKHLSLLGPRSGAIPGVFHGPLWIYLNIPTFVLGQGNPVMVGWFWVVLSVACLFIIYFVTKSIFSHRVAVLSVLLLSVIQVPAIKSLFNPYGALMLSPLFFYLFREYLQKQNFKHLFFAFLILGLIIQFQMAFGGPILILSLGYLIIFWLKSKKVKHVLSLLAILPPMSTFLVFDLKHNFLQTNSIWKYLSGQESHGKINLDFPSLISIRAKEMFLDGWGMLTTNNFWLTVSVIVFLVFLIVKLKYTKSSSGKSSSLLSTYSLLGYFYFGFWLISLAFNGPIWSYYYWPFLPLLISVFCSGVSVLNKYFFYTIFGLVYLFNLKVAVQEITTYNPNWQTHGESSWSFNYHMALNIFNDTEGNFGYFIFTPDLYGYYPQYAMNYTQRILFPNIKASPFTKKSVTYLLIAPPPAYGKDPNSIWAQKNTSSDQWKISDLKIFKEPVKTFEYANGFKVEKYFLNESEIDILPNPYLINSIIFR